MLGNDDSSDVRKELFNKIGDEEITDPIALLKRGEDEELKGNLLEAKKIFKSLIDLTNSSAIRYENQSQHRATAEAYYIQAVAHEHLQQTQERDENYKKVVDHLLSYAKTALAFGEDDRGITSATLAGLVCVVSGNNEKGFSIYTEYESIAKTKDNSVKLVNILYSLGYLIDALKNTNLGALADAETYISKDLNTMIRTAKLSGFYPLMKTAVKYAQDVLQSNIKMPKINLSSVVPQDLLFNEMFDLTISILNKGTGSSYGLQFSFDVPDDLELLSGEKIVNIDELKSQGRQDLSYSLRFQTGLTEQEITKKVSGGLTYKDMLQNEHKQILGEIDLEFRTSSKEKEYTEKLESILSGYVDVLDIIKTKEYISDLSEPMNSLITSISTQIKEKIESQEYIAVENSNNILVELVKWQKSLFEGDFPTKIENTFEQKIQKEKIEIEISLKTTFEEEKKKALDDLSREKDLEKAQEIDRNTSMLKEEFQKDKTEMIDLQNKEVARIKQVEENKSKKMMTELETKLNADFVSEMNKKSDEFETTLQDLRNQHTQELETEKTNLKNNLIQKHNDEITSLMNEKDGELRRLKESEKEEKESKLSNLRTKLVKEKEDELITQKETIESELRGTHSLEVEELTSNFRRQLDEKQKQIDDLSRKIREFSSSTLD